MFDKILGYKKTGLCDWVLTHKPVLEFLYLGYYKFIIFMNID